jgi:hypothetical protein
LVGGRLDIVAWLPKESLIQKGIGNLKLGRTKFIIEREGGYNGVLSSLGRVPREDSSLPGR